MQTPDRRRGGRGGGGRTQAGGGGGRGGGGGPGRQGGGRGRGSGAAGRGGQQRRQPRVPWQNDKVEPAPDYDAEEYHGGDNNNADEENDTVILPPPDDHIWPNDFLESNRVLQEDDAYAYWSQDIMWAAKALDYRRQALKKVMNAGEHSLEWYNGSNDTSFGRAQEIIQNTIKELTRCRTYWAYNILARYNNLQWNSQDQSRFGVKPKMPYTAGKFLMGLSTVSDGRTYDWKMDFNATEQFPEKLESHNDVHRLLSEVQMRLGDFLVKVKHKVNARRGRMDHTYQQMSDRHAANSSEAIYQCLDEILRKMGQANDDLNYANYSSVLGSGYNKSNDRGEAHVSEEDGDVTYTPQFRKHFVMSAVVQGQNYKIDTMQLYPRTRRQNIHVKLENELTTNWLNGMLPYVSRGWFEVVISIDEQTTFKIQLTPWERRNTTLVRPFSLVLNWKLMQRSNQNIFKETSINFRTFNHLSFHITQHRQYLIHGKGNEIDAMIQSLRVLFDEEFDEGVRQNILNSMEPANDEDAEEGKIRQFPGDEIFNYMRAYFSTDDSRAGNLGVVGDRSIYFFHIQGVVVGVEMSSPSLPRYVDYQAQKLNELPARRRDHVYHHPFPVVINPGGGGWNPDGRGWNPIGPPPNYTVVAQPQQQAPAPAPAPAEIPQEIVDMIRDMREKMEELKKLQESHARGAPTWRERALTEVVEREAKVVKNWADEEQNEEEEQAAANLRKGGFRWNDYEEAYRANFDEYGYIEGDVNFRMGRKFKAPVKGRYNHLYHLQLFPEHKNRIPDADVCGLVPKGLQISIDIRFNATELNHEVRTMIKGNLVCIDTEVPVFKGLIDGRNALDLKVVYDIQLTGYVGGENEVKGEVSWGIKCRRVGENLNYQFLAYKTSKGNPFVIDYNQQTNWKLLTSLDHHELTDERNGHPVQNTCLIKISKWSNTTYARRNPNAVKSKDDMTDEDTLQRFDTYMQMKIQDIENSNFYGLSDNNKRRLTNEIKKIQDAGRLNRIMLHIFSDDYFKKLQEKLNRISPAHGKSLNKMSAPKKLQIKALWLNDASNTKRDSNNPLEDAELFLVDLQGPVYVSKNGLFMVSPYLFRSNMGKREYQAVTWGIFRWNSNWACYEKFAMKMCGKNSSFLVNDPDVVNHPDYEDNLEIAEDYWKMDLRWNGDPPETAIERNKVFRIKFFLVEPDRFEQNVKNPYHFHARFPEYTIDPKFDSGQKSEWSDIGDWEESSSSEDDEKKTDDDVPPGFEHPEGLEESKSKMEEVDAHFTDPEFHQLNTMALEAMWEDTFKGLGVKTYKNSDGGGGGATVVWPGRYKQAAQRAGGVQVEPRPDESKEAKRKARYFTEPRPIKLFTKSFETVDPYNSYNPWEFALYACQKYLHDVFDKYRYQEQQKKLDEKTESFHTQEQFTADPDDYLLRQCFDGPPAARLPPQPRKLAAPPPRQPAGPVSLAPLRTFAPWKPGPAPLLARRW